MKKIKLLIVAVMALCLCAAMFVGCGKKTDEATQGGAQPVIEYKEGYVGDPIDEYGNQGEYVQILPEEFEQPAVENIEDEEPFFDEIQEEVPVEEEIEIVFPEDDF